MLNIHPVTNILCYNAVHTLLNLASSSGMQEQRESLWLFTVKHCVNSFGNCIGDILYITFKYFDYLLLQGSAKKNQTSYIFVCTRAEEHSIQLN